MWCGVQAVEDGTLEETEAKKQQRKRKKKPNPSDADDMQSKVSALFFSCIYIYTYAHWVTSFITSRPVCVYSCSQLRELWFNDLFMYLPSLAL